MIPGEQRPTLSYLLAELRHRRWTTHTFGPREAPELFCAAYHWERNCSDVLILRSQTQASAYRGLRYGVQEDLFAPQRVLWQYHGHPEWTVRAILTIPAHGAPGAPDGLEKPHPLCLVPTELRQRAFIRQAGLVQTPGWTIR